MSRWQRLAVAVAFVFAAGGVEAGILCNCRVDFPVPPSDGVAGGDWSSGYQVDFGYATVPPKPATGARQAVPPPAVPASTTVRPTPPPATPPVAQPKLHLLILVDDADKDAGPANKAGAALFEKTIRAGLPDDRLKIETLSGPDVTLERIRGRVAALGVRPQDTLIGFYSGAGEFDERARTFGLTPAGGDRFQRSELRDLLVDRKAALTVVLTDTPAHRVIPEMVPPHQRETGPFSLDRLVFRNRGVVDWHAAALNETAFPRDSEGGLFTLALVDQLRQLRSDGPDPIWPVLFERLRAATDQSYVEYRRAVLTSDKVSTDEKRAYREQTHQTPTALTPLEQVKPAPPPAGAATVASPKAEEIVVRVPDKAKVFVEDKPTKQVGPERRFETAELQPGRAYVYTIKAELDRGGRTLTETKRITVHAGETVDARFDWPK